MDAKASSTKPTDLPPKFLTFLRSWSVAADNSAAVITREVVVVKEDDKIVESVDKNKDSIVRIYANNNNAGDVQAKQFIGLGTIVSKDGLIATGDIFADMSGQYLVTIDNNIFYNVAILAKKETDQFYFLKIIQSKKSPVVFTPVTFSDSDNLKLGQTVIAWGGQVQNSVSTGIVSSLIDQANKSEETNFQTATTTLREIVAINTNINLTDSISGGPLLNLYGEMVGLRVSPSLSDKYTFIPANILKKEVVNYASIQ